VPTMTNRRVLLKSRPTGAPKLTDFEIADAPMPTVGDGEILCRTIHLSLDPYMRGRMNDVKSYTAPRAFIGLLRGENLGKMLVKVGPDPSR
jgi:NADPH-dependent curcumin reductase CurA